MKNLQVFDRKRKQNWLQKDKCNTAGNESRGYGLPVHLASATARATAA